MSDEPKSFGEVVAGLFRPGQIATAEPEMRECPHHGGYRAEALKVGERTIYSNCPMCAREATELAKRQEADRRGAQQRAYLLQNAAIPPRHADARLDLSPTHQKATSWLQRIAGGAQGNLFLLGDMGVGKSHLACALLHAAVQRGMACRYVTEANFVRELKSTWGTRESEASVFDPYARVPLLVYDDIGAIPLDKQRGSVPSVELIFARSEAALPTIFVSNLTTEELKTELGTRAWDRMRDQATKLEMRGNSRRMPGGQS